VYAEPTDLDQGLVEEALRAHWHLRTASLVYEPVGFGTHHYIATDGDGRRWFVNVDDLSAAWNGPDASAGFDNLDRAFRTAVALRDAGLEFVHAPVECAAGVIVRLTERYAVSLYRYVDGTSNEGGAHASDEERRIVLGFLGRIHATGDRLPKHLPRRESFAVPLRAELFEALDDPSTSWSDGPFAEPAREMLAATAAQVRDMFRRYDELVGSMRAESWVVTHGEPHGSNIIRTTDEDVLLIDWDTVALGPRERDLWMVEPRDDEDWLAYTSAGGVADIDPSGFELYEVNWALTEIGLYTQLFRSDHVEDANTRAAWNELKEYLGGD